MDENYSEQTQYFSDINTRLRDVEEKQRLLKDRTLLIGQNLINEKEDTFKEIQDMKKLLLILKDENLKMKSFIQRMADQISEMTRKEEFMILQRQFDMFKPHIKK
jgi:hypothetical protein|tara:strand:- start:1116 stop:1430 length:315 start_codon:yes stop_codon:yes gene_type:complete